MFTLRLVTLTALLPRRFAGLAGLLIVGALVAASGTHAAAENSVSFPLMVQQDSMALAHTVTIHDHMGSECDLEVFVSTTGPLWITNEASVVLGGAVTQYGFEVVALSGEATAYDPENHAEVTNLVNGIPRESNYGVHSNAEHAADWTGGSDWKKTYRSKSICPDGIS